MVYLLCFDKKYKHAKHYIGFTENGETGLTKRLERHKKGQGARLIEVITKAGIGFTLTRTWPEGDRNFERKLKNQKKSSALCPLCKERARRERVLAKEAKVIEKMNQPPVLSEKDPNFVVCPVVVQAKEREEVTQLVAKGNALAQKFGVETEVSNVEPTSIHDSSGWSRVRNTLARFWQFLTS